VHSRGACNSRPGSAAREYALRYPSRRPPYADVYRELELRLRETESVKITTFVNAGHPRTVRTPANEDAKLAAVERVPWGSSSDIERELGLFESRVLEVHHVDQLHPHHYLRNAHVSRRSSSTDEILRMATTSTHCG
jgi:hypothetical protein